MKKSKETETDGCVPNCRADSGGNESYRKAVEDLIERDRQMTEARAEKLRILHDIVKDTFDAVVLFGQHYSGRLDTICTFSVFHEDPDSRATVKAFVKDALSRIGVAIIWEGRDVMDIPLRKDRATAHEKVRMWEILNPCARQSLRGDTR